VIIEPSNRCHGGASSGAPGSEPLSFKGTAAAAITQRPKIECRREGLHSRIERFQAEGCLQGAIRFCATKFAPTVCLRPANADVLFNALAVLITGIKRMGHVQSLRVSIRVPEQRTCRVEADCLDLGQLAKRTPIMSKDSGRAKICGPRAALGTSSSLMFRA